MIALNEQLHALEKCSLRAGYTRTGSGTTLFDVREINEFKICSITVFTSY